MTDKAPETSEKKASAKTVFEGPNGAKFVPARSISPRTLAKRVKAGDWTPITAAAKALATSAAKAAKPDES